MNNTKCLLKIKPINSNTGDGLLVVSVCKPKMKQIKIIKVENRKRTSEIKDGREFVVSECEQNQPPTHTKRSQKVNYAVLFA